MCGTCHPTFDLHLTRYDMLRLVEHLNDKLEQRASSALIDASSNSMGGGPGVMEALLARISELERSFADSTMRMESARSSVFFLNVCRYQRHELTRPLLQRSSLRP